MKRGTVRTKFCRAGLLPRALIPSRGFILGTVPHALLELLLRERWPWGGVKDENIRSREQQHWPAEACGVGHAPVRDPPLRCFIAK